MFTAAAPPPADDDDKKRKRKAPAAASQRERMAAKSREKSKQVAEIGPPPPRNEQLWERYRHDLPLFLAERFPHSTGKKPLSPEHILFAKRIQSAVLTGGLELGIMFRGFAKSTITENSAIWATAYGHSHFFVPIGASDESAQQAVDSIQMELETNDLLAEIFPAVCHAARALEGVPQRAKKQTIGGERTLIEWTTRRCVFPTVAGFEGSGAIIWPRSITAKGLRGMRFKRPDGTQARPSFVMLDDFQTDETAANPTQCNKLLRTIRRTVLRLAGHDKAIACVCNATPIEPDDAVEQLAADPAWRVTRVPMLKSLATAHDSFWLGEYRDVYTRCPEGDDEAQASARLAATELYKKKRQLADAGASATWETGPINEAYEISAIQHAYNLLIEIGEDAFLSECQVAPKREESGLVRLTVDEICRKQSEFAQGVVPPGCTALVAKVDVHPSLLYVDILAAEPGFTAYLVDEATFPDQRRRYFAHTSHPVKLGKFVGIPDVNAAIYRGLELLLHGTDQKPGLLRREWLTPDGTPLRITQCGIDGNGQASDVVNKFIRASPFASLLYAEYGRGITAKQKPMVTWPEARKQPKSGPAWINTKGGPGQPRGSMYDTNFWKAGFHRALALPPGARGAFYLYRTRQANDHRMRAEHYLAEPVKEVTHEGNTVYEFAEPKSDNHKFDCSVGALVALSRAGISSLESTKTKRSGNSRKKVKYGDGNS
jgi:hypothetical protein